MTLGTGTGEWRRVAKARGAGYSCKICGKLEQHGWEFWPDNKPLTSTAFVCTACAESL